MPGAKNGQKKPGHQEERHGHGKTRMSNRQTWFDVMTAVRRLASYYLASMVMAALASNAPAAEILRLGIDAADAATLDPHFAATRNDRAVMDMVFNGLLRYKPGRSPQIEPDIATSVPVPKLVDGRQEWVFNIRNGIVCPKTPWTTAYELTADDVVYSIRKSADPKRSAYAGEYVGIFAEKINDYAVKIIATKPLSSILFFPKFVDYAGGFIICRKAIEAMGDEAFKEHPVGTGPFVFENYASKKHVLLKANRDYFRGAPNLAGVEIRYLPKLAARSDALKVGEVDVIAGSEEASWLTEMRKQQDVVVDVFGVGQPIFINFNTSKPPLDDVRVRKAIAHAMNRETFRMLWAAGVAENIFSPVPSQFLPGGLTGAEAKRIGIDYPTDLEKARRLLSEAGLQHGFSIQVASSERRDYAKIYESMRDQLAPLGIKVDVRLVEHAQMHKLIRADKNPIVVYNAWRPNADVYLTRFFHSNSIVVTGRSPDTNFAHYTGIDKLIEAARATRDPRTQIRIWKQAQIKLLGDMVVYPLHYVNLVYARRAYVDYGHELKSTVALYPQITEQSRLNAK